MLKPTFLIVFILLASKMFAQEIENNASATTAKEEFKVKREEVFEFVQKPTLTLDADNNTVISFEVKAFCDATIAIENSDGKIVRHLASGVLGAKAPAPFQKSSKVQKIIWDGKDDQEVYINDKDRDSCIVRVSLGLKPQLERTLFWSPHKKTGTSFLTAAPEGVIIGESSGIDHVRLYDRQGNFLRTIFPFPSDKISSVKGLKMHTFVQDGKSKPLKRGYLQSNLLTLNGDGYEAPTGITAITTNKGNIAISGLNLNRLAIDGSSGGLSLYGPTIALPQVGKKPKEMLAPRSIALSPDNKWLYVTGYVGGYNDMSWGGRSWGHMVMRMPYGSDQPPTLFAGDLEQGKTGTAEGKFRMPTSVACDDKGRVYVSDYMNNRIQIFDPDGKFIKAINIPNPNLVKIHQKTGDIFVFSLQTLEEGFHRTSQKDDVEAMMYQLGTFDDPKIKSKYPIPLLGYISKVQYNQVDLCQVIELDSWSEKTTIWVINNDNTKGGHVQILEVNGDKLVLKNSFVEEAKKSVKRLTPPILWRQRLVTNPKTGKLYVLEGDSGVMKSVNQLVEISPDTGAINLVDLPLGAEDLCFDLNGLIYLRTDTMVVRYDPTTWKEIPFDYGIELNNHSYGMGAKAANMVSGLQTPGHRSFAFWQLGGIDINVKGHIAVTTCNGFEMTEIPQGQPGEKHEPVSGKPYKPETYPGRMRWGEVHIWDKYGKIVSEDVIPGMGHLNGIGIDQDNNIYVNTAARRIIGGKQTDPDLGYDPSGTIIKLTAGKNKTYNPSKNIAVPMAAAQYPKRSMDISGMTTGWVEGAEWFYGGIGFSSPSGCVCWNSRFSKDLFNRSIAPESMNYSVAIIDSSGNLILRVGKYGNINDGKPLIADGGPKITTSIGGDEVSLFYACYVASYTDKQLFIADAGNARIVSVKLNYNTEEKMLLKNLK